MRLSHLVCFVRTSTVSLSIKTSSALLKAKHSSELLSVLDKAEDIYWKQCIPSSLFVGTVSTSCFTTLFFEKAFLYLKGGLN